MGKILGLIKAYLFQSEDATDGKYASSCPSHFHPLNLLSQVRILLLKNYLINSDSIAIII